MMIKCLHVFVLIGFAVFLFSCEKQTPVARVENYFIYADELDERMESSREPSETYLDILKHVNRLVDEKLQLCDAYQSDFEHDSVVVSRLEGFEAGKLYSHIVEKEIINKIVTASMIRERYRQLSQEWHARHILLPVSNDSIAAIKSLKSLRSRILRGEDFGTLARDYSKDPKSAGKNGDLGFISYDTKKWDVRFLEALSSLTVGQVSDIVRSNLGFHLIKLEQIREVSQASFREEKENIKNIIIRENIAALDSAFYEFRSKMNEKYDAEQLGDNVDSLLVLIKRVEAEHIEEKVNLQRDPRQFRGVLTEAERTFPLASYRGGYYTLDDLLETYNSISPMRRPLFNSVAAIEEFLRRNVPRTLMIRRAYERGMHRLPQIRKEVQAEKERLMISRVKRVTIDHNTEPSEDELRQIYHDNSHLYENDVRVKVQEIVISNLQMAQDVYEKAVSGDDFDALAREFNERDDTKDRNGILGFLASRDYGPVSRTAVRMRVGEISEPIQNKNRYSIIQILDRTAGDLKPFEDVRLRIRREKRIENRDQLTAEWMDNLRNNYDVAIFDHAIKKGFEIKDE